MRVTLAFRQNWLAIVFVLAWLGGNAALFGLRMARWPSACQSFTDVVVFGFVVSMIVTNVTRRYRPEETCRALASGLRGHTVVVGYTNFGRRIVDMAKNVAVIESNRELLTEKIVAEEPLVVGDAQDRAVLESAAVARAKRVVIATDDLETAAVAARHVRDLNESCELVIRCPDDDVGAVLAKAYRAKALSTSKIAATWICAYALRERRQQVMIIGRNNIGKRVQEALDHKRVANTLVDLTDDAPAGVENADLVVMCDDDLGKNLLRIDRIRDRVRPGTKIVCRAFQESAAEVLKRPPLDCVVFSSSKLAADTLKS